jgi:hypothetical protein
MNCIEAFARACIINRQNYIQISEELKKQTGWFNTNQSIDDLYNWMIQKYGVDWDLCQEEGDILRTMEPASYFKILEYYERKRF